MNYRMTANFKNDLIFGENAANEAMESFKHCKTNTNFKNIQPNNLINCKEIDYVGFINDDKIFLK